MQAICRARGDTARSRCDQSPRNKCRKKWQHSRHKGIIALYVVVNALVQYVFDAAAIETALEQLLSLQMVLRRVLQELRLWPLHMNQ